MQNVINLRIEKLIFYVLPIYKIIDVT